MYISAIDFFKFRFKICKTVDKYFCLNCSAVMSQSKIRGVLIFTLKAYIPLAEQINNLKNLWTASSWQEHLTLNHTLRNEYKLHLWTSSSVGRAIDS